ncbi:MAG: hypothetical protein IJS60_03045 [Abditibacteriota bacterium]|nr:hypothetical protein [Abditibacteriota bacterium]
MIDLSQKKFPDREREMNKKKIGRPIHNSAFDTFVKEGSLYVRSINCNRQIKDIDFYSSNITTLAYNNGYIIGATSGEKSVIFLQVLHSAYDCAAPIYELKETNNTVGIATISLTDIIIGSNNDKGNIIKITGVHGYGDVIQEWDYPYPEEEKLLEIPDKILTFKQSKKDKNIVYIITDTGKFIIYNIEENSLNKIGILSENFFSKVICEGDDGNVYLFKELGGILIYKDNKIEETGIKIPCFPGKGPYAKISAAIWKDNTLIVGDTEGLLSKVILPNEECKNEIIPLGKPTSVGGIDFLVEITDGRIYGVAGSFDGMAHLFLYNPKKHSIKDLGVCCATVEKGWYGYVIGDMVVCPDGHIVLGENDKLGCLFHYYPPIV